MVEEVEEVVVTEEWARWDGANVRGGAGAWAHEKEPRGRCGRVPACVQSEEDFESDRTKLQYLHKEHDQSLPSPSK